MVLAVLRRLAVLAVLSAAARLARTVALRCTPFCCDLYGMSSQSV